MSEPSKRKLAYTAAAMRKFFDIVIGELEWENGRVTIPESSYNKLRDTFRDYAAIAIELEDELITNWITPTGDVKADVHNLIQWFVAAENDPLISSSARERLNIINRLEAKVGELNWQVTSVRQQNELLNDSALESRRLAQKAQADRDRVVANGIAEWNKHIRELEEENVRLRYEAKTASEIARNAALDEVRDMLATTWEKNPLIAIDNYRRRYPKHGQLDEERRARQEEAV